MVSALVLLHRTADAAPVNTNEIVVAPAKGELAPDKLPTIRVTFPTPMVDLDKVQRGGQPSPIVFEPTVEIRWMWLSQTEGKITFPDLFLEGNRFESAAEVFRVRHRAKLRSGLRDLAANPVDVKTWGVEYADDQFALKGLHFLNVPGEPKEEQEEQLAEKPQEEDARSIQARSPEAPLPARPRLRLEFSRNVTPQDVAKVVYFQDRKTGERFPVEVNIEERQQLSPQGWFLVEPANPLPPGRAFLLVIERLKEPEKGETLTVLRTVAAGSTYAPEIKDARGYNQPMKGAFLRAVANQGIDFDPENRKLVTIDPPVADLRFVAFGNGVEAQGKFDTSVAYNLTFKAGLLTNDGFRLANDSVWKITFGPKRPAIILPERYIFQRASAPSVHGSFVQVNTDKLSGDRASRASTSPKSAGECANSVTSFETKKTPSRPMKGQANTFTDPPSCSSRSCSFPSWRPALSKQATPIWKHHANGNGSRAIMTPASSCSKSPAGIWAVGRSAAAQSFRARTGCSRGSAPTRARRGESAV